MRATSSGRRAVLWAVPALLVAGVVAWLVASWVSSSSDDELETWGRGWELEGQRQVLAWDVWVAANGLPPGHDAWLAENAERFPAHSPEGRITGEYDDLTDAPSGTPRGRAGEELRAIVEDLREEGREPLVSSYAEWRAASADELADVDPSSLVERYLDELEQTGGGQADAQGRALRDLVADAGSRVTR